jgi:ATP-dependent protease HslVU (ClpYQ) ATPase subunit
MVGPVGRRAVVALRTAREQVFRELKFELPSTHVKRFVVTAELVNDSLAELKKLLAESLHEEQLVMRQLVHEFADRFRETHELALKFTDDAADWIAELAGIEAVPVRDLCAKRFKDFQFGLKLIAQNTGQKEFTVDRAAAETPDKALSDWVVASYRK